MAGRRSKHAIDQGLLISLVGIFFALWIVKEISQNSAVLLFIVVAAGAIFIVPRLVRDSRRQSLYQKANAIIDHHIDQLARRRAQLVREDAYGRVQLDKWAKEIDYFVMHHVSPALTAKEQALLSRERTPIVQTISERAEILVQNRPVFTTFSSDLNPAEFEIFCAEQLKRCGWNAHVTLQSRDQGVDVIAEKWGLRVVLQCKLYSGPVGNHAVQEIAAGKAHAQAHWGAVVTNNRYTSAAEELASTNGILLLHYSDLVNLDSLLQSRHPGIAGFSKPRVSQTFSCPSCYAPVSQGQVFCGNCGTRVIS